MNWEYNRWSVHHLVWTVIGLLLTGALTASGQDPRHIVNGHEIPSQNYADQPYIVVTKEGNWLCTLTTGPGIEGEPGQHIVATISEDKGETWSPLIDIEPADGPEASWVTAAKST